MRQKNYTFAHTMNARFAISVLCIHIYGEALEFKPSYTKEKNGERRIVRTHAITNQHDNTHILFLFSTTFTTHISNLFEHFILVTYIAFLVSLVNSLTLSFCFILYYIYALSPLFSHAYFLFSLNSIIALPHSFFLCSITYSRAVSFPFTFTLTQLFLVLFSPIRVHQFATIRLFSLIVLAFF